MSKTYWEKTGKYEELATKLHKRVPAAGVVPLVKQNPCLEKFRKAQNCYYDLFNNGLCNRAKEFRTVFGFGGKRIANEGFPACKRLEDKLDEIILNAAKEQRFIIETLAEKVAKKLFELARQEVVKDIKKLDGLCGKEPYSYRGTSWRHLARCYKDYWIKQAEAVISIVEDDEKK